ncbi:hypothetical protein ACFY3U_24485 [Micromonospora sp. NPDC000089]|uniref:hypothetical protein n=1 Tax=unclassified Micromonospora TaxID=2617518 RepID=UPI00368C73D1
MKPTHSPARRAAGGALLVAALGIVVQIVGGADYPTVPPGLLILTAAALAFLLAPWRWAVVLAAAATLFISVGGVLAPNFREQLGDPGDALVFAGSLVQAAALAVALLFAVVALTGLRRDRAERSLQPHRG